MDLITFTDPKFGQSRPAKPNQVYSGADIQAVVYLPLLTKTSLSSSDQLKFKKFADIQTISISSTRSVSPVRVLGRSSPVGYTRGARTFAGSLVFATIARDPFADIQDSGINESVANASTSFIADQLPPFTIVITACNEAGSIASQAIHGITITNYGTTYSIDDLYTETTYTYVATDVVPLNDQSRLTTDQSKIPIDFQYSNVSSFLAVSMGIAYGTQDSALDRWRSQRNTGSRIQ